MPTIPEEAAPETLSRNRDNCPVLMFVLADGRFFLSHRLPLAIAARAQGFRVMVACPADDYSPSIVHAGLEHIPFAIKRSRISPLAELGTVYALAKILRTEKPDIVHLVASKPVIYGGLLSRLFGIPSVVAISGLGHVFIHGGWKMALLRKFVLWGYRWAINHPQAYAIVQNSHDFDILLKEKVVSKNRTRLINGSGVDLRKIHPSALPQGNTVFALPARMLKEKGVLEFVEAAKILRKSGAQAGFMLVGSPDMQNPSSISEDTLISWDAAGIIQWIPHVDDMNKILAKVHVVVLPSHREGFPKTIIDAAAAGRMSVASDVPGCRDAIVNGKTGLLFEAKNVGDLVRVLGKLIGDRQAQQTMGDAARRHAEENFDINQVCKDHMDIYKNQLLLKNGSAAMGHSYSGE